jgi:hypothetical protein
MAELADLPNDENGECPAGPPDAWLDVLRRIDQEVTTLLTHRQMWKEFQEVASRSQILEEESDFYFWVMDLYGPSQALGIRKMNDRHSKTGSFKRLLQSMSVEPQRLTAEWFRSETEEPLARELDADFATHADPQGLGHLNPEVPRDDMAALNVISENVKRYVDQHVAHAQLQADAAVPVYSDLDAALDKQFELLQKYTFLLRRSSRVVGPAVMLSNWRRVFYEPWLVENQEPPAGGS